MSILINPYSVQSAAAQNIFQILTTLGYTSGLQFALDAGEGDSYTSGQSWLDLTANDQDFFLGVDINATATDPTFNGVADALSSAEFFSFDGGDYFNYDTTNETWMENMHKDNALFSWVVWVYPATLTATGQQLFSTSGESALTGAGVSITGTSNIVTLAVRDAASGTVLSKSSSGTVNAAAWNFVGGAIDEAGDTSIIQVNGTATSSTATYTSPAATAANHALQLGGRGTTPQSPIQSGGRMGIMCMWNTALTAAQLMNIFAATRGRFGV